MPALLPVSAAEDEELQTPKERSIAAPAVDAQICSIDRRKVRMTHGEIG